MGKFVYKTPLDRGYKQFKLTKKKHNELFKHRKIKWYDKYEYYYDEKYNNILLHRFYNWKTIIFCIIMFPFNVLYNGLGEFKELMTDYMSLFNQKKYGEFASEIVKNKEICDEVEKIILKQNKKVKK